MTTNKGKGFEQDFKDSLSEMKHIWTFRPSDFGGGLNSRFTNHSLCDYIVFNNRTGNLFLFELKSTQSTSIPCPPIKEILSLSDKQNELSDKLTTEEKKAAQKLLKEAVRHLNSYKIKYHQLQSLLDIENNPEYTNIHPYFLLNFRNTDETYLMKPSDLYAALEQTQKASINIADIKKHNGVLIKQEHLRKTQHFVYDMNTTLEENYGTNQKDKKEI